MCDYLNSIVSLFSDDMAIVLINDCSTDSNLINIRVSIENSSHDQSYTFDIE